MGDADVHPIPFSAIPCNRRPSVGKTLSRLLHRAAGISSGMEIISRTKAISQGQIHYFTGKLCKRGHRAKRSVYNGNCSECQSLDRIENSIKRYDLNGAKQRKRERTGKNRLKFLARQRVNNALRSGLLVKRPCEICGTTDRVHAHHDDYNKPLDVMWLCPQHHHDRHRWLKTRSATVGEAA